MKKILIVEDEIAYVELLHDQLSKKGYTVIQARDGGEGLELAKKEKPDLILLDIRMPVMDGLTMLKLLRKEKEAGKTKVIILTNLEPDDKIITQVIKTEPTYYCVKSDTGLDNLIEKIRELIVT
ncbi:MAG TPA: response regulator [Candidatus Sulfotelmatobacter sp.]|jgi:CheY-like chemotaxis protein|nr:response regulator [Candidatus Sulfotelmatobacter sp.]